MGLKGQNSPTFQNKGIFHFISLVLDASAKIPDGLLGGKLVNIGQFDECLKVDHPAKIFQGKHCMASIYFKAEEQPLTYFNGLCVPSSCLANNLTNIMTALKINGEVFESDCWTREPRTLSDGSWAFV